MLLDASFLAQGVGRRAFLRRLLTSLAGGSVALRQAHAILPTDARGPGKSVIGYSQAGDPLEIYHLGRGRRRVLILGGQHGKPEANTVDLARLFIAYFGDWPYELPRNLGLDIMPVANPDGLLAGSRQFLDGVDPNRNWDSEDWRADGYNATGQLRPGFGGVRPFSAQETRALAEWVLAQRPAFVVNYHSAGGFVLADRDGPNGELASTYVAASGYWWPPPDVNPFAYPISGSMDDWLARIGIPNLFVELTTYTEVELDRNLAGLRAVLQRLSTATPKPTILARRPTPPTPAAR